MNKNRIYPFLSVFFAFVLFSYVIATLIILPPFRELEKQEAIKNLHRSQASLNTATESLMQMAGEYAMWDATYDFVRDQNREYADEYLEWSYLNGEIRLNTFFIVDLDGQVLWGESHFSESSAGLVASGFSPEILAPQGELFQAAIAGESLSGIMATPQGLWLLVARPIVRSNGEGPARGVLLVGHFLSDEYIHKLSEKLKINFHLVSGNISEVAIGGVEVLSVADEKYLLSDDETLVAYHALDDLFGRSSLTLVLNVPRNIYQQGLKSAKVASGSLIGIALILALLWSKFYERTAYLGQTKLELDRSLEENALALQKAKVAKEMLHRNNYLLETILESTAEGILVVNKNSKLLHVNSKFADLWNFPDKSIDGKEGHERLDFVSQQLRDPQAFLEKVAYLNKLNEYHLDTLLLKDGRVFERFSTPLITDDQIEGRVWSFRDVTEQSLANKKLQNAHDRLKVVIDSIDSVVYVADLETHEVLLSNKHAHKFFGDIDGKMCWQVLQSEQTGPCDFCTNDKLVDRDGNATGIYRWEFQNTQNDEWYDCHDQAIPWTDGRLVRLEIATNITERKRAKEVLQQYAKTQESLLQEVNHRVKNNLMALVGLLHKEQDSAQANHQDAAVDIIKEVVGRVQSLATVHSLLSANEWKDLNLGELCSSLITATVNGLYGMQTPKLEISPTMIEINSDQAHHLALVINEITTNSIKYAFGEEVSPQICVSAQLNDNLICLSFRDNGSGFPQSVLTGEPHGEKHTGLRLAQGIISQSLRGHMTLSNENGAVVRLQFPREEQAYVSQ